MKAKMEVQMDNTAFHDDAYRELARILENLAERVKRNTDFPGRRVYSIQDANGNTVGQLTITRKD